MASIEQANMAGSSATVTSNVPEVVFILGCPGSGKGTLCKLVSEKLGYYHLSVGDYLRELAKADKADSLEKFGGLVPDLIRHHLQSHKLVSPQYLIPIIQYKVKAEQANGYNKFLVDGFPRNAESAREYEKAVGMPNKVILFDCPRDIAKVRFGERRREPGDVPHVFEMRCDEFEQNNPLIVAHYDYGSSFSRVDTSGPTEASFKGVMAVFGVDS